MRRLVIGILAHVDSGKTTLSEGLLFRCGEIRKLGRVDNGNAFLDSHALERERGITIFSKQAIVRLEDIEITLLDTPGHVDFSAEMERTLQVLDYAILVISGTDGVQSHTKTLWHLLERYKIPTFVFVNKMDIFGADNTALMIQLKNRLHGSCIDFSTQNPQDMQEEIALCNERLMEQYLATGAISASDIQRAICHRQLFPCYFGSALKLDGIDLFLQGLERFLKEPAYPAAFGAKIFKISTDEQGARLTHLKITGGSLKVRTALRGQDAKGVWTEKASQLRIYSGCKYQTVDEVFAGTVCTVTGLTRVRSGEGLGEQQDAARPLLQPVLTYRVELPLETPAHTALAQLKQLAEEDPQLSVEWDGILQEIHVRIMGEIQLEVLRRLIAERFGIQVNFGQGRILYLETIAQPVEGVGHFEPLRHYAEVHLLLEPRARGSGLLFSSDCREDQLDRGWQHLIVSHLMEKIHIGVLTGAPITDMKITLRAGRGHLKHTEGGDFRQATYRAVRQGLRSAQSVLLEPWYDFTLELPAQSVGRALSDLQRMNAEFTAPQMAGDTAVISGCVPVAAVRDYQMEVAAYTRGQGRLACVLQGYQPCKDAARVIAETGYDCDADVDNPADSVFCAHGAGFTVKWDEVHKYMHLESVIEKRVPQAPTASSDGVQKAVEYGASLAMDKELLAIYERTYGTIKRDSRAALHRVRETPPPCVHTAQPPPDGPEYLLVDGYNIIFAWEELRELARENMDAARSRLCDILCNYQGVRRCELILVFDAYKIKGNLGAVERYHTINVVYTREAETADMYIEKVTHALGKKYRVRVATSDAMEQLIILGHGALRISAEMFREEVEQARRVLEEFL